MVKTQFESKRRKRRKRRAVAEELRKLDGLALQEIHKSMIWSMNTWGGTRCQVCGQGVRPHWQVNLSGMSGYGWLTAFGISNKHKCPGEEEDSSGCGVTNDWESKAISRFERKEKRRQLQPWLFNKR